MVFTVFLLFLILLRLGELLLARRNERWLRSQGAVEYGQAHYPYMVLLHVLFFLSLIAEYLLTPARGYSLPLLIPAHDYSLPLLVPARDYSLPFLIPARDYSLPLLILYFLLLALKVHVISSLGRYWNTKIFRIPGRPLVKKGPYRFLKHPNYAIVVAEIGLIPLIFHLYLTAIVFTLLNAGMLYVRIGEEDRVLRG